MRQDITYEMLLAALNKACEYLGESDMILIRDKDKFRNLTQSEWFNELIRKGVYGD